MRIHITTHNWLKSAAYLPAPLRDFHDQKDVFKALWSRHVAPYLEEDPSARAYLNGMTWTSVQIFTIDFFLWFMAAHGWTLQRSKKRVEYGDLDATIRAFKDEQMAAFAFGAASKTEAP